MRLLEGSEEGLGRRRVVMGWIMDYGGDRGY